MFHLDDSKLNVKTVRSILTSHPSVKIITLISEQKSTPFARDELSSKDVILDELTPCMLLYSQTMLQNVEVHRSEGVKSTPRVPASDPLAKLLAACSGDVLKFVDPRTHQNKVKWV